MRAGRALGAVVPERAEEPSAKPYSLVKEVTCWSGEEVRPLGPTKRSQYVRDTPYTLVQDTRRLGFQRSRLRKIAISKSARCALP
jgi:hypothetical protein